MPLNLIFIQPGNYTIDDNGIPGDNISVIRDGNGVVIFTFAHPADSLGFTVSVPGVNITVNFTDSMNAANFTIGSTDPDPMVGPPQSPDSIVIQNIETTGTVTLVANGSITEGPDSDVAPDIFAGAIVLSAGTGIGLPLNPIETRTGLFEAETKTGGIAISNFGSVQIGGVTANVDGLDVATSGDINFITVGSIFLTEANSVTAGEVVHGGSTSGNVILTALGVGSDIIGNVNNGAVTVPRGSLVMTAGRDIQLGTIGADFNNDIITSNDLTLLAGRDILIDGFADVLSDNFGLDTGGDLIFTAGRNIGILNVAGVSASATASGSGGGNAILTTGFNGSLTVNGPGSFALGSTSGDVIIRADRLLINGGSGISAPSGDITIRTATDGRAIVLGSATDAAFALELSNVEMNRIFTGGLLTIGSDQAGQLRVIAPINVNAVGTAQNLRLESATSILIESGITTVGSLSLRSLDDIFQTSGALTTGTLTAIVDFIDDDSAVGGTATFNGAISATSNVISGNVDADTLRGTNGPNTLQGLGGNDNLFGNGGSDTLDGGGGVDTMIGGAGDDVYFVDNAADAVAESAAGGFDLVFTSVTYSLSDDVERIGVNGFDTTFAINLTGNAISNEIFGNDGANILNGLGGADILRGNGGDDFFIVDNAGDLTIEAPGDGLDTVFTSVTYSLSANVERLGVNGFSTTFAINLTGNGLDNEMWGNDGANILNGGAESDVMNGFGGNDVFIVDNGGDVVNENPGGGLDTVFTSISYTLGGNVERLGVNGFSTTFAISLTGNGVDNEMWGNDGINTLDGRGGADILHGNGGADSFSFTTGLAPSNVDLIVDFVSGLDRFVLDDAIFTGLPTGALAPGAFRVGSSALDPDDRIVYDNTTGALFFDSDGSGPAAPSQFATLSGSPIVAASDFVVI